MIKYRIILSVLLLYPCFLLLHPLCAFAENRAWTVNITPTLGEFKLLGNQDYDSGFTWGLGLGLNFTKEVGAEFTFDFTDSGYKGDDAQISLKRLDLLYHLTGSLPDNVVPFIEAGFGMGTYRSKQLGYNDDNDLMLNAGVGLKYFLTRYLALRGDVLYLRNFAGSNSYNNLLYTAGITFQFGLEEEEPVIPPPIEPVHEELCPSAPDGCIEKDWCKKDSDGDGVPDCIDKCPNTPKGIKVDAYGCPPPTEQGSIVFRNIVFDFNKSNVKPDSYLILDQVVEYMKANPGIKMEIQGHTDNKGTDKYNMKLSARRADSVKKYLVSKGVASDRLEVKGFGLTKPIAPNDTEENRARNRRVEFKPI